jgi:hypothetical protein
LPTRALDVMHTSCDCRTTFKYRLSTSRFEVNKDERAGQVSVEEMVSQRSSNTIVATEEWCRLDTGITCHLTAFWLGRKSSSANTSAVRQQHSIRARTYANVSKRSKTVTLDTKVVCSQRKAPVSPAKSLTDTLLPVLLSPTAYPCSPASSYCHVRSR